MPFATLPLPTHVPDASKAPISHPAGDRCPVNRDRAGQEGRIRTGGGRPPEVPRRREDDAGFRGPPTALAGGRAVPEHCRGPSYRWRIPCPPASSLFRRCRRRASRSCRRCSSPPRCCRRWTPARLKSGGPPAAGKETRFHPLPSERLVAERLTGAPWMRIVSVLSV